jgi:hypothetical protein
MIASIVPLAGAAAKDFSAPNRQFAVLPEEGESPVSRARRPDAARLLRPNALISVVSNLTRLQHRSALRRVREGWRPAERSRATGVPTGIKAAEQLENRGMGKPKETIETETGETPAQRMLRSMSIEQLEALVQRRAHLQAVDAGAST